MVESAGTSGGRSGTSGRRARLAIVLAAGFALILAAITVANAESMISDFAAAGVPVTPIHVWIWELTSVAAWLTATPLIWLGVARFKPPRLSWPMAAMAVAIGLPLASSWHIGGMIGLREIVYAARGERYHFEGGLAQPYLYEFRKDVATYLQFVALAALAQWLLARADVADALVIAVSPAFSPRTIDIADGATRHQVPVDTIEHVAAAGNYVEIAVEARVLLHRATLAAVESDLGDGFARIHRSRLVNRAMVRRIETDRSGDFVVELASGAMLRGSRRYRQEL